MTTVIDWLLDGNVRLINTGWWRVIPQNCRISAYRRRNLRGNCADLRHMQNSSVHDVASPVSLEAFDSSALYNVLAPVYEDGYRETTYQRAYDLLAWQRAISCLPPRPCTVIDAGCGTGRWADWLINAGHHVVGIEQSSSMIDALESRALGERFRLVADSMENVDLSDERADAVFAMGSLQFTADPANQLKKFASWVRPGGYVAVYVDSLVALVLELLRLGKDDEAMLRLQTRTGVWRTRGESANVHLYDEKTLREQFEDAGLRLIHSYGLLASASAYGSADCNVRLQHDECSFMQCEFVLSASPLFINLGKHIFMVGQRPPE
jgi:SAM-dependent methyltransferase